MVFNPHLLSLKSIVNLEIIPKCIIARTGLSHFYSFYFRTKKLNTSSKCYKIPKQVRSVCIWLTLTVCSSVYVCVFF
jgi:hypothetical protein